MVRLEANITGMEGRKVFLSCEAQSSDRTVLFAEASGKTMRIFFLLLVPTCVTRHRGWLSLLLGAAAALGVFGVGRDAHVERSLYKL